MGYLWPHGWGSCLHSGRCLTCSHQECFKSSFCVVWKMKNKTEAFSPSNFVCIRVWQVCGRQKTTFQKSVLASTLTEASLWLHPESRLSDPPTPHPQCFTASLLSPPSASLWESRDYRCIPTSCFSCGFWGSDSGHWACVASDFTHWATFPVLALCSEKVSN